MRGPPVRRARADPLRPRASGGRTDSDGRSSAARTEGVLRRSSERQRRRVPARTGPTTRLAFLGKASWDFPSGGVPLVGRTGPPEACRRAPILARPARDCQSPGPMRKLAGSQVSARMRRIQSMSRRWSALTRRCRVTAERLRPADAWAAESSAQVASSTRDAVSWMTWPRPSRCRDVGDIWKRRQSVAVSRAAGTRRAKN